MTNLAEMFHSIVGVQDSRLKLREALRRNVETQRALAKRAGRASVAGDRESLKRAETILERLVHEFEGLLEDV